VPAAPQAQRHMTVHNGRFPFGLRLSLLACTVLLAACSAGDTTSAAEVITPLVSTTQRSADLSAAALPAGDDQGQAVTPQPSPEQAPAPPTLAPGAKVNDGTGSAPSSAATPSTTAQPSTVSLSTTTAPPATTAAPVTTAPADPNTIVISLTLHVVKSTAGSDDPQSSRRTKADLEQIGAGINQIWAQANVVFDPITVTEIEFPPEILQDVAVNHDTRRFLQQLGQGIVMDRPGTINGFYIFDANGVAGYTPQPSQVFFIADQLPSPAERVSAHEIGHVLRLDHPSSPEANLMTAGTGSQALTAAQMQTARQAAQRLTIR